MQPTAALQLKRVLVSFSFSLFLVYIPIYSACITVIAANDFMQASEPCIAKVDRTSVLVITRDWRGETS